MATFKYIYRSAYAPQPNWGFNADANMGHAFGIFMALTCPLPAVPVEWK